MMYFEKANKRVRFSDNITIFEVGNSEEHRSARNGLQLVQDRLHFQRRIQKSELILYDILNTKNKKFIFLYILPFNICNP